jgi:ribosomal protein L6P/L9E
MKKFRCGSSLLISFKSSFLSINSSFHARKHDLLSNLFISSLAYSLFSTFYGFLNKYRFRGLGHRIYIRKHKFVFSMGYSHLIYRLLDLDLSNRQKKTKKVTYFCMRGVDNINLRNSIFNLQSIRIPNCYCSNGIFIHGIHVIRKQGKKPFGFML